jgi:hypothetical protein
VQPVSLAQLSYEAALRALDVQERAVDQLRGRTGTLMAASSLTASFIGSQAIQRAGGIGASVVLALLSLGASIVLCLSVLLPQRGLVFSVSGLRVFETSYGGQEEGETYHRLVHWLEGRWMLNQEKIDALGRYFLAAAMALTVQLVLWTWVLASSIS